MARRPAPEPPAPRSRWRPDHRKLLYLAAMLAAVALPAGVTFGTLGPWLETLSGAQRAGLGVLVGVVGAAPWTVRLLPDPRPWVRLLLQTLTVAAGTYLGTVWIPPRSYVSSGVREEIFRARAEWYIPMSIASFLAVVVLVEVLAHRADVRRTAALHEQHMAEVRRELTAGRRRRGR